MMWPCTGAVFSAASASSCGAGARSTARFPFCEPVRLPVLGMSPSYAKIRAVVQERRPLDTAAFALMLVLTMLWGFQQVTVKWIAADVPFVVQAAIRSVLATLSLVIWARWRVIVLLR